jgi:hypothetical protein
MKDPIAITEHEMVHFIYLMRCVKAFKKESYPIVLKETLIKYEFLTEDGTWKRSSFKYLDKMEKGFRQLLKENNIKF